MGLFQSFDIAASGMTAQRFRMDVISENIASINTTRTENGTPYRRKTVTFQEREDVPDFQTVLSHSKQKFSGNGVRVSRVGRDYETDFVKKYDPSNPDADEDGYVSYPNVDTVTEMTNLIDASRSYEANATAFNALKTMTQTGINVGGNS